jgi:alpha-galactosidase
MEAKGVPSVSVSSTAVGTGDTGPESPAVPVPAGSVAGSGLVHLRAAGVSVVLDCRGPRLPRVLHWGAEIAGDDRDLAALAETSAVGVLPGGLDVPAPVSILPEHATGWPGRPGLTGNRAGAAWSALFDVVGVECRNAGAVGGAVAVSARDRVAGLELELRLELAPSGVLRARATVRNVAAAEFAVDGLCLALPVPAHATELADFSGRWGRERAPQRRRFTDGAHVRAGRRGRTGADAAFLLIAAEEGTGFGAGRAWGVHVGWSGNHCTYAERLASGESVLGGGELLLSGEVRLPAGAAYTTPWLYAAFGDGLDAVAHRFHAYLRARPGHPPSPRPVLLNTWEAVYFDHDLGRLRALAQAGAAVGVERFVLDDGWFRGRRDDQTGLGDWAVDPAVWPDGLHPIVAYVRGLGMEFGLWVEPEMVNPDSDLARAHPEWIMATGDRLPPSIRSQQVLDLAHPGAYGYLRDRLSALVEEYALSFFKWDHNRDLIDAGHSPTGEAGVHAQTLAVYRLIDELRARFPGLEIESCSSGGARVDLGILERTDRVWASDCIDALERQSIQRWTTLLLPPELVGAHVGAARAHTTGRTHDLAFRAGTALFGHFGIEWDLTAATEPELAELAAWVAVYKRLRAWLHTGRVVRADHPDPAVWVHGIVSADAGQALFAVVSMTTSATAPPGRVRIPGLDPARRYRVAPLPPGDRPSGVALALPPWLAGGVTMSGRLLAEVGVPMPPMHPEQLLLLHLTVA